MVWKFARLQIRNCVDFKECRFVLKSGGVEYANEFCTNRKLASHISLISNCKITLQSCLITVNDEYNIFSLNNIIHRKNVAIMHINILIKCDLATDKSKRTSKNVYRIHRNENKHIQTQCIILQTNTITCINFHETIRKRHENANRHDIRTNTTASKFYTINEKLNSSSSSSQ